MTRSSILDLPLPDPIELRDPSLGRMLAAPLRLNILADVADIPLDNISADDFAVRFLASVARQVSEEAQAIRDNYEAAMSLDAAAFRALSKDALDKLVGTYLAAEAKSIVMKSRSNHGTIDALPGERESERLLRLIKIAMADFRTTVEKSVGTFRQHFAHIQASLNYIGQSNQAAFAALHKITAPRLHLPEVKLPDLSGQIASVAQAMAPIRRQQVEFVDLWRGITEQLRPATEKFIESIRDFHKGFQARLEHYPKLSENIVPLAQRGWFVSEYFDIDELDLLAQAAASSLDELEQCIAKLYKENFVTHLQSIIRDYPERDFILRPAGDAHLRGEYGLSITAFFSQIDGICFDAYEKYIFFRTGTDEHMSSLAALRLETVTQGDDNNPFGQFLNLRHEIMWRSISEKLPIGYSVKERKNFGYTGINRHTVLHGTATKDYATKENSLSAFSFLSYIASLAKMDSIRNWSKETE